MSPRKQFRRETIRSLKQELSRKKPERWLIVWTSSSSFSISFKSLLLFFTVYIHLKDSCYTSSICIFYTQSSGKQKESILSSNHSDIKTSSWICLMNYINWIKPQEATDFKCKLQAKDNLQYHGASGLLKKFPDSLQDTTM